MAERALLVESNDCCAALLTVAPRSETVVMALPVLVFNAWMSRSVSAAFVLLCFSCAMAALSSGELLARGRLLRVSSTEAVLSFTVCRVLTALPAVALALESPVVTVLMVVVACCMDWVSSAVPWSSPVDVVVAKSLMPFCAVVMSVEVAVRLLPASTVACCRLDSDCRAALVVAGVSSMVLMIVASLPRAEAMVLCASSSDCTVLVCMVPAVVEMVSLRVFRASESTSLTVETKVLFTWVSTVPAPVSVIFGAMALTFSLT